MDNHLWTTPGGLRPGALHPVGGRRPGRRGGLPVVTPGGLAGGGLVGDGLTAGVLAKPARPAADAVAKHRPAGPGRPRSIELLVPVVLAVLTKRAPGRKGGGPGGVLGGGRR
ncbi:hypothetical protein [Streptomyces roseoviridis]|uniref:Uncharacterized protein n=1 Tax=Streptomyces roseoviridis TaxID=67361 RepID=A0ABV5QP94_9ACTN